MRRVTARADTRALASDDVTDKASVDLSGAAQTMLTTLYSRRWTPTSTARLGRSVRQGSGRPNRLRLARIGITGRWAPLVTVRTAQYDIWASQFLAVHQHATVVHLGCGLDSRVFRLDPGPGVEWYDVDYPAVIALREKIFPTRPRYHLVATSATDPSWLDQIPADRPVLLLAEGISMYLTERRGRRAAATRRRPVPVRRTADRLLQLARNQVAEDAHVGAAVRFDAATGRSIARQDILSRVPGVRLLIAVTFFDASTFSRASAAFRLARRLVRAVPPRAPNTAIPPLRVRAR